MHSTISNRESKSSPIDKIGRVKVGVRCRPPFPDEIDGQGSAPFFSIVQCHPDNPKAQGHASLARVGLTLMNGNQRDFAFDYTFDPNSSQDQVFDKVARPVVGDVLRGFNGTIFAYGQTGTGKTYTMGILDFVNDKHAGIIPRSMAQIFDFVSSNKSKAESTITLSFLQLYRDTIHDLLSPPSSSLPQSDETLNVREDPARGFYVDGLKEYIVRNYNEAEALVNLGLENRAIAPTLMNTTSSRSHTILTINIEQRGDSTLAESGSSRGAADDGGFGKYSKTTRSKLLMVDLAGSERVRRTLSKGTRLSEAKSINSSLSALGNVIAALADPSAPHVPYRASKLTRLLQDSLGGTASTAMIATIGPAAVNYNETLSTLQFASRCMAVKSKPVLHEEVNYAELCAVLQMKLSNMEGQMAEKLLKQQQLHEAIIREITGGDDRSATKAAPLKPAPLNDKQFSALRLAALDKVLVHLNSYRSGKAPDSAGKPWLNTEKQQQAGEVFSLFAYSYELLRAVTEEAATLLRENISRDEADRESVLVQLSTELEMEKVRDSERMKMEANDPAKPLFQSDSAEFEGLKSHLIPVSRVDVLKKISIEHGSNNAPTSSADNGFEIFAFPSGPLHVTDFNKPEDLALSISDAHTGIYKNLRSIAILMSRKDEHFRALRDELAAEIIERKKREEEVVNWSYILKYLLGTISKLREQLSVECDVAGGGVRLLASLVNTQDPDFKQKLHDSKITDAARSSSASAVDSRRREDLADQSLPLYLDKKLLQGMSNDRLYMSEPTPSEIGRRRTAKSSSFAVGSSGSALNLGALRDNRQPFSETAVDPRRRVINNDFNGAVDSKSPFATNIEPSPLQRIALRPEKKGIPIVDQIGPPSDDDSAQGNTTQYDDEERGKGSPSGRFNNFEESSEAYRSETFRSEITYSSYRDYPSKPRPMPSRFAQSVAQDLGVNGQEASAAMSIIDQLSLLTDAEINAMDQETKIQILQLRRQLGMSTSESRPVDAVKSVHNPIARSNSAGPRRVQSGGLSAIALRSGSSGASSSGTAAADRDRSLSAASRSVSNSSTRSRSAPRNGIQLDVNQMINQRTPKRSERQLQLLQQFDEAKPTPRGSQSSIAKKSPRPNQPVRGVGVGMSTPKKYSQLDEIDPW